jgi:hypothetical protein
MLIILGWLLITTACGWSNVTSPMINTRVAQNAEVYATTSALNTAQANTLSIKKTELSSEMGTTPPNQDGLSWITRWLINPTCQPPCWENINPGITTIDEAAKIVFQIPGVDITWLPSMTGMGKGYKRLSWDMEQSGHGSIDTERDEDIVPSIHLAIEGEQKLFLGNTVSIFGNPSMVIMNKCFSEPSGSLTCPLYIVFKEKGMALFTSQNNEKIDLQADTEINKIFLYPVETIGTKIIGESIAWSGYGSYNFSNK